MSTNTNSAASASSRISSMFRVLTFAAIVGMLAGCAAPPPSRVDVPAAPGAPSLPSPSAPIVIDDGGALPPARVQGRSRWQPVRWSELPGFGADALNEAWNAWIRSCERPLPPHAALCPEVRRLSIGTSEEQRSWMVQRLQPYR